MPGILTRITEPGLKPSEALYGPAWMCSPRTFVGVASVLNAIRRPVALAGSPLVEEASGNGSMQPLLPGSDMNSQPEPVASVGRLWAARWLLARPSGEASALAASAVAMNTIKAIAMASLVGILIPIIPP